MRYRVKGTGNWREGLPLWFDKRNKAFRGSLVGLTPGTEYEIVLTAGGKDTGFTAATRANSCPAGKITYLENGVTDKTLTVTESGSPGAWHVIMPAGDGKTVINGEKVVEYNVIVDADYVVLRGLVLKGAQKDAVRIRKGRHDIVIEDCHINYWGRGDRRVAPLGWGDSGINARRPPQAWSSSATGSTIQPAGPTTGTPGTRLDRRRLLSGIPAGGNIIRYNEIVDRGPRFQRCNRRGRQDSNEGAGTAIDIYGNLIEGVWDDAIESEGEHERAV